MTGRPILMTGVGGFLGSALAAAFLKAGPVAILSLAPDDATGRAARAAVAEVLSNSGGDPRLADGVEPVTADLLDPGSLDGVDLSGVGQVWHVAARMSYAPERLVETVDFNVNGSSRLMGATPPGARFFHVSTTGIAGPGDREGSDVPERLVDTFEPLNPYSVSKQLAEQTLFARASLSGRALTILRPGSIVGSSDTGWSNGTRYGYYSYLQAFKRYLGRMPTFSVAIEPERRFPVIHVDHLVRACVALSSRGGAPAFEVFNLVNDRPFTVAEHFGLFEEVVDRRMRIGFGTGDNAANRAFNALNADNNRFMGTRHRFETGALSGAVGPAAPPALTRDGIARVMRRYLDQDAAA